MHNGQHQMQRVAGGSSIAGTFVASDLSIIFDIYYVGPLGLWV